MTDYKEEQAMEVEALESIYMDEFKLLTNEPLSYQVHIVPNQDGQNNHVALTLKCVIPATYPDVEPKIDVVLEKGLSDTQLKEIIALLTAEISENVGMAMVFTLCEATRAYLVDHNQKGNDGSEYQDMLRRMDIQKKKDDKVEADLQEKTEARDAEQRTKNFVGTAVTVETFAIWRAAFENEMLVQPKATLKDESIAKLTGKQLWTKGLVDDDDTADAAGNDDVENEEENEEEDDESDGDYEDEGEEDDDA